mgnify:CR=1 FL=1
MAVDDNLNNANKEAKELRKEVGFLIDAFSSLGATIQGSISDALDDAQGLTKEGQKITKAYGRDISAGLKKITTSLDKSFEITQKIKSGADAQALIDKERIRQQSLVESIQTRINLLKDNNAEVSEEISLELENQVNLSNKLLNNLEKDNKERQTQGGLLLNTFKGADQLLQKSGFGSLSKKLELEKAGRESKNIGGALGKVGKNLVGSISKGDVLLAVFTKIAQASKQADTNVANLRRGFGVSASEGIKLNNQFVKTAISSGDVTANVESLQEANQNINDQLGIQVVLNDELLVAANALVKRNKLSAEAAAGFSQQVLATGVGANALLDASAETVAAIQNQTGVQLSFNSILEESNKVSGQLRANLLRTPDGLVKAVATAKTLGVEMSAIAGIAGQLLDFESSITKELEAELLIGKDLNLEQARLLALQGKSDEAVSSLVSQIGTLEDFQKLNVIQQNALASAVGMTSDQLATTVEKQAAINSQKQEGLAIDAESMKEGASALSIQEQLASAVTKLNSILQGTAVLVATMSGALVGSMFGPVGAIIGAITGLLGGIGIQQTVMDGIAPSSRGPFTITDSFGATAITAQGDGIAVSPNISQGSGGDIKETNRLLRAYLEKGTRVNVVNTDFNNQMSSTSYAIQ